MIGELPCEPVRFREEGLVLELMTWAGGACLGLRLNFFAFDWCFSVEVARAIHTGLGIIEEKKNSKRKRVIMKVENSSSDFCIASSL